MNILTKWLRTYAPGIPVDDHQLAQDLTLRGIAVEGVHALGANNGHLFEMDITTNRVDAMNHYGIAREAATIYDLPLAPLDTTLPAASQATTPFPVRIEAPTLCGRFTARVLRKRHHRAKHRPRLGTLQPPQPETDLERRRRLKLRPARYGPSYPRLRPRQDRRRHRRPPRPPGRKSSSFSTAPTAFSKRTI